MGDGTLSIRELVKGGKPKTVELAEFRIYSQSIKINENPRFYARFLLVRFFRTFSYMIAVT